MPPAVFHLVRPQKAPLTTLPLFFSEWDYDEPERVVHQRLEIGFMMCGQKVDAKPDVVIMDGDDYILLVQEDKVRVVTCRWTTLSPNSSQRLLPPTMRTTDGARLLDCPVTSKVFAGIVMFGTAPTFYKIPISSELVTAIGRAQYPPNATIVSKLVPPVPDLYGYLKEGMVPLENRRVVF
ncbi:hypothetical protein B0H14DRAFT_3661335 [Mycena olivaceomarginata]|nr:hypothetical protein B0H14DRAFT_3661335 [Mycena olivaceomarginata]